MSKYFVPALLVLAVLAGNALKISPFSPEIKISAIDCVVLILTLLKVRQIQISKELRLFWAIGAISLIPGIIMFGAIHAVIGALYLGRFIVYSTFALSYWEINPWIVGLTFVATGIGQYLIHPDIRSLAAANWDPHYYRVLGTLLDPGFMGVILLMFLLFLLQFSSLKAKLTWIITYLAFAFTYSRSSFLAYFASMGFVAWRRKSWKLFISTWILMLVTLPLLPRTSDGEGVKLERTNSIKARLDNWTHALIIFSGHPILGVGFDTYRYAQIQYGFLGSDRLEAHAGAGSDSSLLFVAATTGFIGLIIYLLWLKKLWQQVHIQPYLVALFFHSWFLNSLFYPFVLMWLAVLMGYKLPSAAVETGSPKRHKR